VYFSAPRQMTDRAECVVDGGRTLDNLR
jgi:hypothetical protein